ncbi:MAG: SAM-dependent chlorinase/fluorinase [Pseudomonadota bacterium]|nr:SAM-dependent chlorinase/fluorinase [Pseudomonadota bacterium]
MIVLVTDFGLDGPYVGQVQAAILCRTPQVPVVNLFADLPAFRPESAAYLVPAFVPQFPENTVFLCVVDPGVGTDRRAVFLSADHHWFVGPDNGMFDVICARAGRLRVWDLEYSSADGVSSSFHGRDIFAPAASKLASGELPPGMEREIHQASLEGLSEDLLEIVYVDHYGNAMTGLRANTVVESAVFIVKGHKLEFSRTFGEATPKRPFWYRNSVGLVEFAQREESVARVMDLCVGQEFSMVRD